MKRQDEQKNELILDRACEDILLDMTGEYPSPQELKGTQKFSAVHEKRMQNIIGDARKRERRKSSKKGSKLYRIAINVAAVFGLLCFVTTLTAFASPPLRVALQNYLLIEKDGHIEIGMQPVDEKEFENEVYNFPSYIPSGFELVDTMEGDTFLMVFYVNKEEKYIRLERFTGNTDVTIDTEDADHRTIDINGRPGEIVLKNGGVVIFFNMNEYGFLLNTDIGEQEAIMIVESISEKK